MRQRKGDPGPAARPTPTRARRVLGHPLTHLLLALVLLAVVQGFFVKVYQVPSASMTPTLAPGDRLLVNRLAYQSADPEVGDIVVFERPADWGDRAADRGAFRTAIGWFGDIFGFGPSNSDALVKRIVAGPGDVVSCCGSGGQLVLNDQPVDEPYLGSDLPFEQGALDCETPSRSQRCFEPIVIPDDRYLMLGDNRAQSSDGISRCRGLGPDDAPGCARLVSREDIVGEAFFVLLPFARWGALAERPG